ncbi:MAG: hypothetical protein U0X91_29930 [Spirosomataceae bacterium]
MNLLLLLPFDTFRFSTELTISEVQARLASVIEPKKQAQFTFTYKERDKPYEGEITDTYFEMSRNISYRNSFLPVIQGEMTAHPDKTEIQISMRPNMAVLVLMISVFGTVGIGLLFAVLGNLQQIFQHGFSDGMRLSFFVFTFGYALLTLGYRPEAQKSKAFLKHLLEIQNIDN